MNDESDTPEASSRRDPYRQGDRPATGPVDRFSQKCMRCQRFPTRLERIFGILLSSQ
jgi:hypothetical protein